MATDNRGGAVELGVCGAFPTTVSHTRASGCPLGCETADVGDLDALLWRMLRRVWLLLAVGVPGLLLGLGPRPARVDSLYGLVLVLLTAAIVAVAVRKIPPTARKAFPRLPRHRPLLSLTGGFLAMDVLLVLWWTALNALSPGTLSPLALALMVGFAGAGGVLVLAWAVRRL